MKNRPVKFTVELFKPLLFVGNHVSNYTILAQDTKKVDFITDSTAPWVTVVDNIGQAANATLALISSIDNQVLSATGSPATRSDLSQPVIKTQLEDLSNLVGRAEEAAQSSVEDLTLKVIFPAIAHFKTGAGSEYSGFGSHRVWGFGLGSGLVKFGLSP